MMTPDFPDLANTLQFRGIRAYQHWNGHTHMTLQDVIMAAFGTGSSRPESALGPFPARPSKSKGKARVKRKSRRK